MDVGRESLAALQRASAADASAKPNSKVAGVQIGLNVPYSFGNNNMSGDDVLKNCLALGVSGLELRTQPVEVWLGVPPELINAKSAVSKGAGASRVTSGAGVRARTSAPTSERPTPLPPRPRRPPSSPA